MNKPLLWGMCAVTLAGVLAGVAAFPVNSLTLLAMGVIAILVGAPVAGTLILDSWRGHHTGGELPPRPAQALWVPEAEQDRGPGDDLTLAARPLRRYGADTTLTARQRIWRGSTTARRLRSSA